MRSPQSLTRIHSLRAELLNNHDIWIDVLEDLHTAAVDLDVLIAGLDSDDFHQLWVHAERFADACAVAKKSPMSVKCRRRANSIDGLP